jgi:phosphatidylglycerol:prolipoprotein diacylglycerol transferase
MKPIPVEFHIGPLLVHTYGIGLAITFWFGYSYLVKRLRSNGQSSEWLTSGFIWIIASAIIGARVVHVIANISFYLQNPVQVPLIWHGGLSSFGGIGGGLVAALFFMHRYRTTTPLLRTADIAAPVMMASWSMGRLLGPQLMYQGGGHSTNAWYGLQYAGQVGYRIPVPIFQSIEDFTVFVILLQLEKVFTSRCYPIGSLVFSGMALWSIERFFDEYLWLAVPRLWDAVEVFSIILFVFSVMGFTYLQIRRRSTGHAISSESEQSSQAIAG